MSDEKREVGTPQWLREVARRNIEGRINTSPYDLLLIADDWEASLKAAVEAEREACAKACVEWGNACVERWAKHDDEEMLDNAKGRAFDSIQCAARIRARSEK